MNDFDHSRRISFSRSTLRRKSYNFRDLGLTSSRLREK